MIHQTIPAHRFQLRGSVSQLVTDVKIDFVQNLIYFNVEVPVDFSLRDELLVDTFLSPHLLIDLFDEHANVVGTLQFNGVTVKEKQMGLSYANAQRSQMQYVVEYKNVVHY